MLSKKVRKDLSELINSLQVYQMMLSKTDLPHDQFSFWLKCEKETTFELFEKYGIELSSLKVYKQHEQQKVVDKLLNV